MSDGPGIRGKFKARSIPTLAPKQEWETAAERTEREMRQKGTVRCALCDWTATGPMNDVIAEQIAHRETHGVSHHPVVAKRSRDVKKTLAKQERVKQQAAERRVPKLIEHIEGRGGWVDREELGRDVPASTIAAALKARAIVKRMRDGVWGYAITALEGAVEDATQALAVPVA